MKSRFDGVDVFAMVCHLRRTLLGSKVVNIYDGDEGSGGDNNNNTTYAFKLDAPLAKRKTFLVLQSGIRFHDVSNDTDDTSVTGETTKRQGSSATSWMQSYANTQPSPFCSKLRKHLRYSRLEQIQQIGQLDRVVVFTFFGATANGSSSSSSCSLILELYSKGNLILTDANYEILALLRSHAYQTTPTFKEQSPTDKDNDTNDKDKNKKKTKKEDEDDQQVLVKVGKIYPVTYASTSKTAASNQTNDHDDGTGILSDKYREWVQQQVQEEYEKQQARQANTAAMSSNKKKNKNKGNDSNQTESQTSDTNASSVSLLSLSLKALLLRNSSGVSHYGPALLEHAILCTENLSPNKPLCMDIRPTGNTEPNDKDVTDDSTSTPDIAGLSVTDWESLRHSLRTEAPAVLERLQNATEQETPGYLLYKDFVPSANKADNQTNSNGNTANTSLSEQLTLPHPDKTLIEFHPHLLKQHESMQYVKTNHFGRAVFDFFAQLQAQKRRQRSLQAEQAVAARLQSIQLDQQQRVQALEDEIVLCQQRAMAVEQNATQVDQALQVVNSALDSGMDWDQLEQVVRVEQEEHANPIALFIKELQLDKDQMILNLPVLVETMEDDSDGDESGGSKLVEVPIVFNETAHGNASRLFAHYRASKDKSRKTVEASAKVMEAAQATAERQLAAAQAKQKQKRQVSSAVRKTAWFEKFHWMITRDNYLVLAGRDAHQNEMLVKRYLRPGDAYLHADVHGAASCILRAKRQRFVTANGDASTTSKPSTRSKALPLSEQALVEAGQFTICHSSAWSSRMVTSAWWVESHQVSKTAPSGEYLTVGSFMIRGKKNYLPPVPLEMGLAVLFRLGDEDSIARHKDKDRRDFQMLAATSIMEEEEKDATDDRETISEPDRNDNEVGVPEKEAQNDGSAETTEMEQQPSKLILTDVSEGDDPAEDADNDVAPAVMDYREPVDESGDLEQEANDHMSSVPSHQEQDEASKDQTSTEEPSEDFSTTMKKKKGFSVRDRKLIKKYGSLEEAERVLTEQRNSTIGESEETLTDKGDTVSEISSTVDLASHKRGKKAKLKRQKKKYADQDDDDRELALLLLHGGTKDKGRKNKNASNKNGPKTKVEQEVGEATAAVLSKDSKLVAESLPEEVRKKFVQCLDSQEPTSDEDARWDQIDGNVVEQLVQLQSEEAQLAAVNRLLFLMETSKVDNLTLSLAGILRTIRKYGHKNLVLSTQQIEKNGDVKNSGPKDDDETGDINDTGVDEIDDTTELSKLTGKPLPEDVLLYAVPVCAPYSTLSQYQYRVKLTPGNGKRGKAAKQCLEFLLQQHQTNYSNIKSGATGPNPNDLYRDLIKRISDNEWVQTIVPDVKISSAGSSKLMKQQQQKGKGGKKKK